MKPSDVPDLVRHAFGRGPFPAQLSFLLDNPVRRLVQFSPAELADRLHLRPDARVLEIGCGPGVFSGAVADRLPHGHLELFDLDQAMLDRARDKLGPRTNTGFTQGDARELPFPDADFDVVFMVSVLGEVPEPERCLGEVARVLRPGGVLSDSEHRTDPDFVSIEALTQMCKGAGLEPFELLGRSWNFTLNARRP